MHPEGSLYYSTRIAGLRFTTDVNISDGFIYSELTAFTRHIPHMLRLLRPENERLNMNNTEIVFDLDSDGYWGYYIADHKSRHLFWLNDFRIASLIEGGDESHAHLSESLDAILNPILSKQ